MTGPVWSSVWCQVLLLAGTLAAKAAAPGDFGGLSAEASANTSALASPTIDPGMEIALDAAPLKGGVRLVAMIWPLGPNGEEMSRQRLALDSFTSSLSFCDASLGEALQKLQVPLTSCNTYGDGASKAGYWGRTYFGAMELRDGSIVDRLQFNIMQEQAGMPCDDGVHGILGLFPQQLDWYFEYTSPLSWPPGRTGACPISSRRNNEVLPALTALRAGHPVRQLGVYWSGQYGRGQGALYLDRAATYNPHYPQSLQMGQARIGMSSPFAVAVDTIFFAGRAWAGFSCDTDALQPSTCVLDLAAQALSVPPEIYEHVVASYNRGLQFGLLSIMLEGAPGRPPVTLEIEAWILLQMGWLKPNPKIGVVLGLPLWAFFYSMFDFSQHYVSFVATRQNNPWSADLLSLGAGSEPFAKMGVVNATFAGPNPETPNSTGPRRVRRLSREPFHV